MDSKQRKEILERARARDSALQNAQPPPAAATPEAPAREPIVRGSFGAEIRIVDPNDPNNQPTERRIAPRGQTVRARPAAGAQAPRGPRVMGGRIVQPEAPGVARMRQAPQQGVYGATVVPSGEGAPVAPEPPAPPPAPPAAYQPGLQQTLRTPIRPGATPQAPGAPGAPQGAPATPPPATDSASLKAQIEQMGRQQAVHRRPAGPAAAAASIVDVTVIMSQYGRPDTLDEQYRALSASGLPDLSLWCWVNPGGGKLNQSLLNRIRRFGSNHDVGPWFRWSLAACVPTKYTLVIDDDCSPGPQWLQLAVQRLEEAESRGEAIVIAAAGTVYERDAVESAIPIGLESLHREEVDVDVGRGAWLMPTELARTVLQFPQIGSPLATAIHVAAAMQYAGARILVLPYFHNQKFSWGMLQPPQTKGSLSEIMDNVAHQHRGQPDASQLRRADYEAYRDAAQWAPLVVQEAAAEATVIDDEEEDEDEDDEAPESQQEASS